MDELEAVTRKGGCMCAIHVMCPHHGVAAIPKRLGETARKVELAESILHYTNGQRDAFRLNVDDVYELCCRVLGTDPNQEHHIDEDGNVT